MISVDYRLEGLAPDSLLAWLATLGVLRALRVSRPAWRTRVAWTGMPLRPTLHLPPDITQAGLLAAAAAGLQRVAPAFDFNGRKGLDYAPTEFRAEVERAATAITDPVVRDVALRLRGALASDIIVKRNDPETVEPTPFCLMFGQGHQHFLERLAMVGTSTPDESALARALFEPWRYEDEGVSFRWDPSEDRRYALQAGDPSKAKHKIGTVAGANRLAVLGLASHAAVPIVRRLGVVGSWSRGVGRTRTVGYRWPLPDRPMELAALERFMYREDPQALRVEAGRLSNGKFMSVGVARPSTTGG
ncbi:MAG: hypothetical protein MUE41_13295 [Gemmatimonadaceae bacterium]|nr:hypothetical protein [Gemmatimonadaceae bacterium]